MNNFNFPRPPMFIGFDSMFDELERIGQSAQSESGVGYPPYNITKTSNEKTVIEIAVAGFSLPDIDIEEKDGILSVKGEKSKSNLHSKIEYSHKGISSRKFKRDFRLAEYTSVSRASFVDGILYIELLREIPDEKKPRRIAINPSDGAIATEPTSPEYLAEDNG